MSEVEGPAVPEEPQRDTVSLPQHVFVGISIVCTALFVLNIVADIFVESYSGYPTTALLGFIVGGVLGIERAVKRAIGGS